MVETNEPTTGLIGHEQSRVDSALIAEAWNFDPDADSLLEPPEPRAEPDLGALSPFHRVLLAIDGTVTKFLESHTLEGIDVVKVSQSSRSLPADHDWLRARAGTRTLARQVVLCGHETRKVYAYAVSLLIPERMTDAIQQELRIGDKGLGRILREHRLETYREVLWSGLERGEDQPDILASWSGGGLVCRTYRIFAGGSPIMLIHEKFPISGVA
jgi:chorismate-pyruvate lyase